MTEKLQTAYNEWLLKYGYRWVDISVLRVDRPLFWGSIPSDVFDKYMRYSIQKYQLKTPEELKDENPTKAP